jgi:N-acetylglucosamine kinase-like BadF-type ATPase
VRAAVLAVDGGNSKTDVLLADADGAVRARVRGPSCSPHVLGVQAAFDVLDRLVADAVAAAGTMAADDGRVAEAAVLYLAGADYPDEIARLRSFAVARGWAGLTRVDNDTLALLRAGTDRADAVAVVCGAGINASGISAAGGVVRYAALGRLSGDWGGGEELGQEAMWWSAREEDGHGPATALTPLVAAHFGARSVLEAVAAIHRRELDPRRVVELAPLVLDAARGGDAVAVGIVTRLAEEVALLATTTLRRLSLLDRPAAVVLGGGVLAAGQGLLLDSVRSRLVEAAPHAEVVVVTSPPVLGAALAGLDLVSATPDAHQRLRSALDAAPHHGTART